MNLLTSLGQFQSLFLFATGFLNQFQILGIGIWQMLIYAFIAGLAISLGRRILDIYKD